MALHVAADISVAAELDANVGPLNPAHLALKKKMSHQH